MEQFYIGKSDILYLKKEDGSLRRFGIRVTPDGLKVFDQLNHEWHDVPGVIPARGKPDLSIRVSESPQ